MHIILVMNYYRCLLSWLFSDQQFNRYILSCVLCGGGGGGKGLVYVFED